MAGPFDQYLEQSAAPPSGGAFDQYLSGKSSTVSPASQSGQPTDYSIMAKDAAIGVLAGPGGMMDVVEKYGPQFGPWGERAAALSGNFRGSLGFADELQGFQSGVLNLAKGGDYISAYRDSVDKARQRLEEARAKHPLTSFVGQLAGGAALAGAGGAALKGAQLSGGLLSAAAGREATGIGGQMALGVIGGGAGGAAYGFGSGDGDIGARLEAAKSGGIYGAALGAVSPALMQGVGLDLAGRPLLSAAGRTVAGGVIGGGAAALTGNDIGKFAEAGAIAGLAGRPAINRLKDGGWKYALGLAGPTERPYQTNALLGGINNLIPPKPGGDAPKIPMAAIKDIDRMIGREQYGVDELASRISGAEAQPLGRTLADVGGEQFLAKADALANLPGQTGPIARKIAEDRARALPGQIEQDLKSRLGVNKTPYQAGLDLEDQMRANGGAYDAVTQQPPKPQVIAGEINPMVKDDPLFQNALVRVQRYENRAASAAARRGEQPLPQGVTRNADGSLEIAPNAPGRTLHLLKMAFDDEIGAGKARTDVSSIGKFEATEIGKLRDEFLGAIDRAIPGYTTARETAGGLFEQQRALEAGAKALSMSKSDIRTMMADMSKFEKEQFRIAVAENAVDRLEGRSGAVSFKNAANAIESNKIQNVFREVFDSPDQAEEFLSIVNERNQLLRNASGWIGNSATARRAAQAGDQALAQMADMGAKAATGNPLGAVGSAVKSGYNALIGRYIEGRNNLTGNALLSIIDSGTPEQKAFNAQLLKELRKLEEDRIRRATMATGEGATGAIGGGVGRDHQEGY